LRPRGELAERKSTSTSTSPSCTGSTTFLGKMGLSEIIYLRLANAIFGADLEPPNYVASVEITMAERFGVEDRATSTIRSARSATSSSTT